MDLPTDGTTVRSNVDHGTQRIALSGTRRPSHRSSAHYDVACAAFQHAFICAQGTTHLPKQ